MYLLFCYFIHLLLVSHTVPGLEYGLGLFWRMGQGYPCSLWIMSPVGGLHLNAYVQQGPSSC